MIREKELIYKDEFVEIGCISKKIDEYEFEMNVVVTNLHTQGIKDVNLAYLCKSDIDMVK